MKNLNRSRSLTEPCDPRLSNAAILKLWRYLRLTDVPNFFTPFEALREGAGANQEHQTHYTKSSSCRRLWPRAIPFLLSIHNLHSVP
jgi:hypothetical protein